MYVNQLEKYREPDLVKDDRQCDLCGARYIDTQDKVAELVESESSLYNTHADVEKPPVGKENRFRPFFSTGSSAARVSNNFELRR